MQHWVLENLKMSNKMQLYGHQAGPLGPSTIFSICHVVWHTQLSLSCSVAKSCPWTVVHQASLSFTVSWGLLRFMSIESVMLSNPLILCRPLLLPSIFPSIRVFSNELALGIRWPMDWSFSFSIRPSNEYSGLISFKIDRLDLLAVQMALKSLLLHCIEYILRAINYWAVILKRNHCNKIFIVYKKIRGRILKYVLYLYLSMSV